MKSKQLYEQNGLRTFVLVMDKGDEAFEQITTFAREHEVTAASLTAIGAATSATLGYFDPEIIDYRSARFDEQMEICSFIGDIASKDGEPALHSHIVLGRKDYTTIGGHLQQVYVFPTMEVVLTETPAHLHKRVDPQTGLALISVDEDEPRRTVGKPEEPARGATMADTDLTGRSVVAIVTNYGVEQDELVVPVEHLRRSGVQVDIAAVSKDPIQTLIGDKDPGATLEPTVTLAEVDAEHYDMVLVPGGTLNADSLRRNDDAIKIVRTFTSSGRPVASICHGPWTLIEAGAVNGKTLTSYPSLQTDIRNAGGNWINEAVVTDDAEGYELITSRSPADLEEFLGAIDKTLTSA